LYIADSSNHRIRKVTRDGVIQTLAGTGVPAFSGDGGPATSARLNSPTCVAVDAAGNLLIADTQNHRIRKVTPVGLISTLAGTGSAAFNGDGGPGTSASLQSPQGLALDATGNLYVADSLNHRVRQLAPDGRISTIAGSGARGFGGDAGPAMLANLNSPSRVAVDAEGNLLIADTGNHRIRKVTPGSLITTMAGAGTFGYSGDGGLATGAQLYSPAGVALNAAGDLFIADTQNHRIRKVSVRAEPPVVEPALGVPFVERQLPSSYTPSAKFVVTLQAAVPAGTQVYAVEDQPPAGWVVGAVSHAGSFSSADQKVRFGPFFDATSRSLIYEVTPPASESGTKGFRGKASADGVDSAIGGLNTIALADLGQRHPADNNPADNRLTISEVTSYGAAWRRGTSWPTGPNPIPISYLTRAGALWRGGETYRLNPSIAEPPLWWVSDTSVAPQDTSRARANVSLMGQSSLRTLVERHLTDRFVPGEALTIELTVQPQATASVYAVEDRVPDGWTASSVSHDGTWDVRNQRVKWGPFFDGSPRVLSYRGHSPKDALEAVAFAGAASFDGRDLEVTGPRRTRASSRLGKLRFLMNGRVELEIHGHAGARYTIEVSSNLADWSPLGTFIPVDRKLVFDDPNRSSRRQTFYRAVREEGTLQANRESTPMHTSQNANLSNRSSPTESVQGAR
ncbi:MAG: hypothetical protein HYY23_08425, partial [Verrucomicrobia bacterium]|nr:hypothetical protein [Verrucomicrobiota bacterium]